MMKKLLLILILSSCEVSLEIPTLQDTWAETPMQSVVSGYALKDATLTTGFIQAKETMPDSILNKPMTKEQIGKYTCIPIQNYPLSKYSLTDYPTKESIILAH